MDLYTLKAAQKHDKTDPMILYAGSLVDPRIRVNSHVKSIFTDLERKRMLVTIPKGTAVIIIKGEYN